MVKLLLINVLLLISYQSAHCALNISSYNIRNFDYDSRSQTPTNRGHLVHTLKELNTDLIGIQEIRNTKEFEHMIDKNFQGLSKVALSKCGGAHGQKLGFIYNTSKLELLQFSEDSRVSNPKDPTVHLCNDGSRPLAVGVFEIKSTSKKLVAISVHLKSGSAQSSVAKRKMQMRIIGQVISEYREIGIQNFAIMGDFNTTGYSLQNQEYREFNRFVRDMKLVNTTEKAECTAYWWGGLRDGKQHPSHLDHILISQELLGERSYTTTGLAHCSKLRCKAAADRDMGVDYDQVSDHCPISSQLK